MNAKRKTPPTCTPKNWEEADTVMAEIVDIDSKLMKLAAGLDDAVAKVRASFAEKTVPLDVRRADLCDGLELYADANRKKLTEDGKIKTVTMTNGAFGWRLCPPSVAFASKLKSADVVKAVYGFIGGLYGRRNKAALKHVAAARTFVRVREEPDKQAMLAAPATAAAIPGIRIITDKEEFFIDTSIAERPEPK